MTHATGHHAASQGLKVVARPYRDAAEEIVDHLWWLNSLLRDAVERFRLSRSMEQRNGLSSLAIFEEEIDGFLYSAFDATPREGAAEIHDRQRPRLRAVASANLGVDLPIENLRRRFGLGEVEVDALLHALAAELHPAYGRVFGYLNNDLTRQRPSVALIVEVLAGTWSARLEARRALGPQSALFRSGLLVPVRPDADPFTGELMVDPSVLDQLLGKGPSRALPPSDVGLAQLLVSPEEREAVERIVLYLSRSADLGPAVVVVSGARGSGRRTSAGAICQALGRPWTALPKAPSVSTLVAELPKHLRDARLAGEVPTVYVPHAAAEDDEQLPQLFEAMRASALPLTFLLIEADASPRLAGLRDAVKLHLGPTKTQVRIRAWKQALGDQGLICSDETLSSISSIYPFSVGRIHAAAGDAAVQVRTGVVAARRLDLPTLARVCREQTDHHLERLAEPLPSRHGWDDLILPADELERLKEIANAVRNRDRVMEDWGFGRKVSAGTGVNAIFFGPSGTGKTMAASILAGELGMAIFRADLSRVVSKYIGETERNLDALFDEARRSFAVLFFDEAEALFGKRSEVKDAHDRYANLEVAYLLQRMERYEGVAILATNLRNNLDNAFLRRLQFAVEFPLPTTADRARIWRLVWPKEATLAPDLDLEFMASHLELSGGHIRNVAMAAAYLASATQAPIGMRHVLTATRREMQKLGRTCVPDQFGPYASLLQGGA